MKKLTAPDLPRRVVKRAKLALVKQNWARRSQLDTGGARLATLIRDSKAFPYRVGATDPERVLLGISSLSSGGAERQMYYTAKGLTERGRETHLLVEYLHDRPESRFFLPQAQATAASVNELSNENLLGHSWLRDNPDFCRILTPFVANRVMNAARQIAKVSPHVLQASLDWSNVTFGLAAALAGVPNIVISGRNLSPIHFDFFDWFLLPGYSALLRLPNVKLTNNSRGGGADYARWLRIPNDRVRTIYNGVETKHFSPISSAERNAARAALAIDDDVRVVAGAFRMSAEKRPLLWVEAAAEQHRQAPASLFLLYGDGPLRDEVRARVDQLDLSEAVRFCGVTPDIRSALAGADLVMLTSLLEGTPNILIEAQALGLPVLTTPAVSALEAVADGLTGRISYDESASGIAAAAIAYLKDAAGLASARAHGPEWVETRFGMARMINDTLAIHGGDHLGSHPLSSSLDSRRRPGQWAGLDGTAT